MMFRFLFLSVIYAFFTPVMAGEVHLAVASNFLAAAKSLSKLFEIETGHTVKISSGSTGKLYAQIRNGAPFEVFLAANSHEPARLENEGRTVEGMRFTYAKGRLALLSSKPHQSFDVEDVKLARRIVLANPKLAPYGLAAEQVIQNLGISPKVKKVFAENVAQSFLIVTTGNTQFGFVALSQVRSRYGEQTPKGVWLPETDSYQAIAQQAVLLKAGKQNPAAQAYFEFLRTPEVQSRIVLFGYADQK